MNNKPVSYRIAKLLKENLFDQVTQALWYFNGSDCIRIPNKNSDNLGFSAPTIGEVVGWIYKKHGIWVHVYPIMPIIAEYEDYPNIVWIARCTSTDQPRQSAFNVYVNCRNNGLAHNHHRSPEDAYEAAFEYLMSENRIVTK